MLIAFEGPDEVGKSTSAAELSHNGEPIYNATKSNHSEAQIDLVNEPDLVQTFDRIDWFSHMVYRLALPDRDWNDDRPRTVFAMPDTHLVVKLHHPDLADFTAEEIVDTPIRGVNSLYFYFADFFTGLNEERDYALFKTVSIVEVFNNRKEGTFRQRLASFSSPVTGWEESVDKLREAGDTVSNEALLELFRFDEQRRL